MKTVFFGDSITAGFLNLNSHENVINLGISGDKINNLIGRIEDVFRHKPDQMFILIGINDFLNMKNYWGEPIKINIKYMYGVLLKLIHDNLPDTKVFCTSILPISVDSENLNLWNQEIDQLNLFIKQLTGTYEYQYLNLNVAFKGPDNQMDPKYTYDGVHLSKNGYDLFYEMIQDFIV